MWVLYTSSASPDSQRPDRAHERSAAEVEGIANELSKDETAPGRFGGHQVAVLVACEVVQGSFVGQCFVGVHGVEEPHVTELHPDGARGPVNIGQAVAQPVLK